MTALRTAILGFAAALLFMTTQLSQVATVPVIMAGTVANLVAIAAVIVGVRRHRPSARLPWFLLAAGLAANMTGASIFYASSYPLIGSALLTCTP
ncbi:hypothetical protein [Winogradskya consettensis]|uniref:hypothetical protein n=1 Tax=Winogradskya consettensis TaxID=113560 RepID=UPI001BB36874|nr:hypothetical protein [Actinoplanes consettensis]